MTLQQAKRRAPPPPSHFIFPCRGGQRGGGLHTLICSTTRDRIEKGRKREVGWGPGGGAGAVEAGGRKGGLFIKEQNIYRKLHSRLLSAALSTRPRTRRLWNTAANASPREQKKKKKRKWRDQVRRTEGCFDLCKTRRCTAEGPAGGRGAEAHRISPEDAARTHQ